MTNKIDWNKPITMEDGEEVILYTTDGQDVDFPVICALNGNPFACDLNGSIKGDLAFNTYVIQKPEPKISIHNLYYKNGEYRIGAGHKLLLDAETAINSVDDHVAYLKILKKSEVTIIKQL